MKTVNLRSLLLLFVILSSFLLITCSKKPASIQGEIVDFDNDREKLAEVKISAQFADGHTETIRSETDGSFQFNNVPPGNVTLLFKGLGYESVDKNFTLVSGDWKKFIGEEKIRLVESGGASLDGWTEENAKKIADVLQQRNYTDLNVAIAIYKKSGQNTIPIPQLVTAFSTDLNQYIQTNVRIVTRDPAVTETLLDEMATQQMFKTDFDPATIAKIGEKIGANVFLMCELQERKRVYRTYLNGVEVDSQALIPGMSYKSFLRLGEIDEITH